MIPKTRWVPLRNGAEISEPETNKQKFQKQSKPSDLYGPFIDDLYDQPTIYPGLSNDLIVLRQRLLLQTQKSSSPISQNLHGIMLTGGEIMLKKTVKTWDLFPILAPARKVKNTKHLAPWFLHHLRNPNLEWAASGIWAPAIEHTSSYMENCQFIDDKHDVLPIKNSDVPQLGWITRGYIQKWRIPSSLMLDGHIGIL